jgi:hypothetical protein
MDFKEFAAQQPAVPQKQKPWKAKRAEAIDLWKKLKPNLPIALEPIPKGHEGTKFRKDGVRITGSPAFISSVLSRLKELLAWERPGYKLDVEYRQVESKDANPAEPPDYVFYIHVLMDPNSQKLDVPTAAPKSKIPNVPTP